LIHVGGAAAAYDGGVEGLRTVHHLRSDVDWDNF